MTHVNAMQLFIHLKQYHMTEYLTFLASRLFPGYSYQKYVEVYV